MDNVTTDGPTSRRFVAVAAAPSTKQLMRYTYVFMAAGIALLGVLEALVFLVGAIVGSTTVMQVGGTVLFFAFLFLCMPVYSAWQRRINRETQVLVCVESDGLSIDTRPGEVFPFSEAQLGPWTVPGYGATTKGTALHLGSGDHRFVLGGRDHRIANGTRREAPPVDGVDAWMWASEFDELLTRVGPRGLDIDEPASVEPIRCQLVPNPARLFSSSFFGMFKNTATALSLKANPPQPSVAIELGEDAISVIDLKCNASIASAPLAQVTATPAESTRWMPKVGTQIKPVLVVSVPDSQPLTIGCSDVAGPSQTTWSGKTTFAHRFSWRNQAARENEPAYVVSDADWLALVEKFGLAADMDDNARGREGTVALQTAQSSRSGPALKLKRPRVWIFFIALFVVVPLIGAPAMMVLNRHHQHANELKADRERPFALPFTGLHLPHGVAADAAGNVYLADALANRVLKLAAGSNTPTVLPFTGLDLWAGVIDDSTGGIAVDAAGNVYVTDSGHNRVLELAAGSSTQTVLPFGGMNLPKGVAVDNAGTVYVADYGNKRVLKLTAGSTTRTVLPSLGKWISPSGVAVDAAGNVYVSVSSCGKSCRGYLLKMVPGSNSWTKVPPVGRQQQYVAVDSAGTLYVIAVGDDGGVVKLTPGSNTWTELPGGHRFVDPQGVAVDNRGNVYVTDHTGARSPAMFGNWAIIDDDSHGFVLKLPTG